MTPLMQQGPLKRGREPAADPRAYQTYSVLAPARTHWRKATCAEADCADYLNGWMTTVDAGTDLGQRQAFYLTHDKERSYHLERLSLTLFRFTYTPGQRCFRSDSHRVRIPRPDRFLVTGGDWRGNPSGFRRQHTAAEFWIEDMQENFESIRKVTERG